MKNLILKYWYVLPILQAVLMIILCLLFTTVETVFESIVSILLTLTLICIVVACIVLLINKQWRKFINLFLISVTVFFVLGFFWVIFAMSAPDGFGRAHPIPDGLKYELPLDEGVESPVTVDSTDRETFLQIWNYGQGGFYQYDFYYTALPAGDVFLRCYEATENIPLSDDRLEERSTVSIDTTYSFSKVVNKKVFTIYEGDWGDYYAARIEVWHRDKATKKECKLLEKTYRVEGWMR